MAMLTVLDVSIMSHLQTIQNFQTLIEANDMITGEHKSLNKRKINLDTTKFFNYQVGQYNGQTVQDSTILQ